MSDEEEEYDNEEDEEGEEEEEEEDEEGDEEAEDTDESVLKLKKENDVKTDIQLLNDIFSYIDRTTSRISHRLITDHRLKESQNLLEKNANRQQAHDGNDDESLHWSQYEDLDEGQRAHLLEKAIMVLGNDEKHDKAFRR